MSKQTLPSTTHCESLEPPHISIPAESPDASTLQSPAPSTSENHQKIKTAFESISDYIGCSVDAVVSEYGLLQKLNERSTEHYAQLANLTNDIAQRLKETNDRYTALEPSLHKIDHFDARIKTLEEAAIAIDRYIAQLENQFRTVEGI